jgi:GNAT superfamily N-acetyltransferase
LTPPQPGPSGVEVSIVPAWDERAIVALYRAGGWWKEEWSESEIRPLIAKSAAFAVAVDLSSGVTVGMGRVISDGISDAYFQDIVVLPDHRRKGVGEKIVTLLIDWCRARGICWIAVVAGPETQSFYQGLLFQEMVGFTPMQYKGGA